MRERRLVAPVALDQSLFNEAAAQLLKDHLNVEIDWRLLDEAIRFAGEARDCWL
ncbi:hypothetical protein J7394_22265 [Ruegeria sp. R13_0]|uniref:hypothetical protein n=1 Tax=Ruegeria sp. R13_0 TaxID=2821099 RepID=UPI001ADC249A|nr:hypothetical protein [Ruegeria sp. R13_0]MBO9436938.1 hypothetical protein [Ruegeria sp. R13_0]